MKTEVTQKDREKAAAMTARLFGWLGFMATWVPLLVAGSWIPGVGVNATQAIFLALVLSAIRPLRRVPMVMLLNDSRESDLNLN